MKLFFTKKMTKEDLANQIAEAIGETKVVSEEIDSDTDIIKPDVMEAMGGSVWAALEELGMWEGYTNFELSRENVSASADDFGESDFVGFHTLDNGLTFLGFCVGGDWEIPVHIALFHDGFQLKLAIPENGNPFNSKTSAAYGNDAKADAENMTLRIMQEQFKDLTVDNMPTTEDDSEDALVKLGEEMKDLINPRPDLMLADLEKDIIFYDQEAEVGQQIELPSLGDITTMIKGCKLDDILSTAITEKAEERADENGEGYDIDGALECHTDTVDEWVEAQGLRKCTDKATEEEKKEEEKDVQKAIRDHFRANMPKDFPLPVMTQNHDVLFKPGGVQEGDQEGEDLGDTMLRQQVEEFKKHNDVERRVALFRLQSQMTGLARTLQALSEADMELLMEESKARTEAEKTVEEKTEDEDGKEPSKKKTSSDADSKDTDGPK